MPAPYRRRKHVRTVDGVEIEARDIARLKGRSDGERGQWAPLPQWDFRRLVEYAQAVLVANPASAEAQSIVERHERDTAIIVDRPLHYEADGNVIFYRG